VTESLKSEVPAARNGTRAFRRRGPDDPKAPRRRVGFLFAHPATPSDSHCFHREFLLAGCVRQAAIQTHKRTSSRLSPGPDHCRSQLQGICGTQWMPLHEPSARSRSPSLGWTSIHIPRSAARRVITIWKCCWSSSPARAKRGTTGALTKGRQVFTRKSLPPAHSMHLNPLAKGERTDCCAKSHASSPDERSTKITSCPK